MMKVNSVFPAIVLLVTIFLSGCVNMMSKDIPPVAHEALITELVVNASYESADLQLKAAFKQSGQESEESSYIKSGLKQAFEKADSKFTLSGNTLDYMPSSYYDYYGRFKPTNSNAYKFYEIDFGHVGTTPSYLIRGKHPSMSLSLIVVLNKTSETQSTITVGSKKAYLKDMGIGFNWHSFSPESAGITVQSAPFEQSRVLLFIKDYFEQKGLSVTIK